MRHLRGWFGLSFDAQTALANITSPTNVPLPPSQHLRTPSQEPGTQRQGTHIPTPERSSVVSTIPELEISVTTNHADICTYVQYAMSTDTLHQHVNTVAPLQSGPEWTPSLPGIHS